MPSTLSGSLDQLALVARQGYRGENSEQIFIERFSDMVDALIQSNAFPRGEVLNLASLMGYASPVARGNPLRNPFFSGVCCHGLRSSACYLGCAQQ